MNICTPKEPVKIEQIRRCGLQKTLCLCKDLGMDCSFEATGTTHSEVMRKFIDHAGSAHNMEVLTADVLYRVQRALQK